MANKIEELKKSLRLKSEAQKKAMEEEVRQLELQLEDEGDIETLQEAEKEADRIIEMKRKERDKLDAEKLAAIHNVVDEDEKERLLKEYEENRRKFEEGLSEQRERTKQMLRARLAARRRKRPSDDSRFPEDEEAGKNVDPKVFSGIEEITLVSPFISTIEKSPSEDAIADDESLQNEFVSVKPMSIEKYGKTYSARYWLELLAASPLVTTVRDIETLVKADTPYIDIKDAQWSCRSANVEHVDINELRPLQFVIYQYGVFITKLLRKYLDVPDVNILLATALPPNDYVKNAFRNSFHYENARKMLYIRQERMDSVGDFIVLLIHCLAHIKVGDLTDDSNVLFLRTFYKGLRVCCQDMFFSRSRAPPAAYGTDVSCPNHLLGTPIQHAFRYMKKPIDKLNVVKELIDLRVTKPVEQDFTQEGFTERFSKYNRFIDNAKLRAHLRSVGAIEHIEHTDTYHNKRLNELSGQGQGQGKLRRTISKQVSLNPERLLNIQIQDLNEKIDNLNVELTSVLKSLADITLNIKSLETSAGSADILERRRKQWSELDHRKQNITRKLKMLESEVTRKEKEKGSSG